ncbi:MAG: HNH endonuclease [Gallionella sp.]
MRESSSKRGYGYKWQQARAGYLRSHPLCADHLKRGQYVQATVVDHIQPHRNDQQLFWDKNNWQSLCEACHNIHKQMIEKSGKEAGCDLAGIPTDKHHHWNQS